MSREGFLRGVLGAVGCLAILYAISGLSPFFRYLTNPNLSAWRGDRWGFLCTLLYPAIMLVFGLWLMISPPRRLYRTRETAEGSVSSAISAEDICRIFAMAIGVWVLADVLPTLVKILLNFHASEIDWFFYEYKVVSEQGGIYSEMYYPVHWNTWIIYFLKLILGVYLFFGAPHLVRWQVRRLKQRNTLM